MPLTLGILLGAGSVPLFAQMLTIWNSGLSASSRSVSTSAGSVADVVARIASADPLTS
ncbi:MAG TPA: hypothetical protein VGN09_16870 [Vicinamibacteria bacterium]